jgi:hypothetical protein
MKKILFIIAVILLAAIAYAGAIQQGTITASTVAQTIPSPSQDARRALITCEGGNVYFSLYSAPTQTTGHLMYVGDIYFLDNYHDIANLKVILTSAGSASTTTYVRWTLFN